MVLISFLCLFTWENRLLCLNLCCFCKTKVEMLKFAALLANCLMNNLWKFHQKILNYSENNEIFVGGCFFWPHPVHNNDLLGKSKIECFYLDVGRIIVNYHFPLFQWELWEWGANFFMGGGNRTYRTHVALLCRCSIPVAEWLHSSAVGIAHVAGESNLCHEG